MLKAQQGLVCNPHGNKSGVDGSCVDFFIYWVNLISEISKAKCLQFSAGLLQRLRFQIDALSSSDVSDMPWVCPQFSVAAVSQKLLPYNIIAFKKN